MWDLDGLLSINELNKDRLDIGVYLHTYKKYLINLPDNIRCMLLKQPVTITTSSEIYEEIGLYAITFKFDEVGELDELTLIGNTNMLEYYNLTSHYRISESSFLKVPIHYYIFEKGDKKGIVSFSFLYKSLAKGILLYDESLNLSDSFSDLLNYDIIFKYPIGFLLPSVIEVLDKYKITLSSFPIIGLEAIHLKKASLMKYLLGLSKLSLRYDFVLSLLVNYYDDVYFESLKLLHHFCCNNKNVKLHLNDKFWLDLGVSDGDKLYIKDYYFGYRDNNYLICER